jgi:hypothetical protein
MKETTTFRARRNKILYRLEYLGAKSHVLKSLLNFRIVQVKALHDAGEFDPETYAWIQGRMKTVSGKLSELYKEIDTLEKEIDQHVTLTK